MTCSGFTILMFGVGLDVGGGDGAFLVDLQVQAHGLALLRNDEDLLQVKHDVGDVLNDAIDGLELMVRRPRS